MSFKQTPRKRKNIFLETPRFHKDFANIVHKQNFTIFHEKNNKLVYRDGDKNSRKINISKEKVIRLIGLFINKNDRRVVWFNEKSIMVWNPKDKKPRALHAIKNVNCLIPLDGTEEVAYSADNKIYRLNTTTGSPTLFFTNDDNYVITCLHYDKENKRLIVGQMGGINKIEGKIITWVNDRELIEIKTPAINFFASNLLLLNRTMHLVSVHENKYIYIWEITLNKIIYKKKISILHALNIDKIASLCVTGDNKDIVTGHENGCIAIWDPRGKQGQCLQVLKLPENLPKNLSIIRLEPIPNSTNVHSFSGIIKKKQPIIQYGHLWKTADIFWKKPTFYKDFINIVPTKNGTVFVEKNKIVYFDEKNKTSQEIPIPKGKINRLIGLSITDNDHRIVWYDGDKIKVWNPKSKEIKTFNHIKKVNCLIPLDGTKKVAYSNGKQICILNTDPPPEEEMPPFKNIPGITCLHYDKKSNRLIVGQATIGVTKIFDNGVTRVLDSNNSAQIKKDNERLINQDKERFINQNNERFIAKKVTRGKIEVLGSYSKENKRFIVGLDIYGETRVFDSNTLEQINKDNIPLIVGQTARVIRVLNANTLSQIRKIDVFPVKFFASNLLNLSKNKQGLVCAGNNGIQILNDFFFPKILIRTPQEIGKIKFLCVTGDKRYIVTGHDGYIAIWHPWGNPGQCLQVLKLPENLSVIRLAPIPNSMNFYSISIDPKTKITYCHSWQRCKSDKNTIYTNPEAINLADLNSSLYRTKSKK